MKHLSDTLLIEHLEKLVVVERRTTAEILEVLKEVDSRRLYLNLGFTSLFGYLTDGLGYSPASAQRRVESARLLRDLPEMKIDLESGELNLTQVSLLAQGLRQMKTQCGLDARGLLSMIKNQDIQTTQKIIAEELDLPMKKFETMGLQKDDSTRLEITFSEQQMQELQRVKELISHSHPNPSWADLISLLTKDFLKRRDPAQKKPRVQRVMTSATEVKISGAKKLRRESRRFVSAAIKREVFQRDGCCQWRDPKSGRQCGSRFQRQIDHKKPIWAGGDSSLGNL